MNCDICKRELVKRYVDGATRGGPWGNLCLTCHRTHGIGLGLGLGQLYEKQPDGKWKKLAG